jgi:hypothetical protein
MTVVVALLYYQRSLRDRPLLTVEGTVCCYGNRTYAAHALQASELQLISLINNEGLDVLTLITCPVTSQRVSSALGTGSG